MTTARGASPGFSVLETFEAGPMAQRYDVHEFWRWANVRLAAVVPRGRDLVDEAIPLPPGTNAGSHVQGGVEGESTAARMVATSFPALFHFDDDGSYWTVGEIVGEWAREAHAWYREVETLKAAPRAPRHADEYARWVALTQALAGDGSPLLDTETRRLMRVAADRVHGGLTRLSMHVSQIPGDGRGRAELVLSLHLWALAQFVGVLKTYLHPTLKRAELTRVMFMGLQPPDESPLLDEAVAWKMRAWRFERRIRPGEADALMASVISNLRTNKG